MYHPQDMATEQSISPFSFLYKGAYDASQICLSATCSGKSTATFSTKKILGNKADLYTSLTLASLHRKQKELNDYYGHMIVDDLGAEKSLWSRLATITVMATLVHTHYVHKLTLSHEIDIAGFNGSASLNVQPILMNSLIQSDDWIAVVRDKVLRYYHLVRPTDPQAWLPIPEIDWGEPYTNVQTPKSKKLLWWQLIAIGLTQWSKARCLEHIPALLRACASLDNRLKVKATDYKLLIKLLKPMQLERYAVSTFGFEYGRTFQNDTYCLLVELVSHGEPTLELICEDYKCSPTTVERIVKANPQWVFIKAGKHKRVAPMPQTEKILDLCGVNDKW